jgi:hypothetical protein
MNNGFIVCEHIKDNGVRCGSPAMRHRKFCFYHLRYYDPTQLPGSPEYRMPVLDSFQSIQLMVSQLQRAYLAKTITDREMTNLLYSLQLASNNGKNISTPNRADICSEMTSGMMDVLHLAPGEFDVSPAVPDNVIPVPRSPEEAIHLARQLLIDASPECAHILLTAEERKRNADKRDAGQADEVRIDEAS